MLNPKNSAKRLHLTILGAVQGVGFRPFIYRLATEMQLTGWVNNSAQGVFIEVEGTPEKLQQFLLKIETEKPDLSIIQSLESSWLDAVGYTTFEIRPSVAGAKTALVLPDISTCKDCRQEIFNPHNRRYLYPFTNCTNCGPRYTIIEALPYDRGNTTMKNFVMCQQCQQEYENPLDRRFHAQPNACPNCGPALQLWDNTGKVLATHHQALTLTAEAIRKGNIIAIKGLGGFHLITDATNATAIQELRQRKKRSDKPFALLYPTLELIKQHCRVSPLEERLLLSPEAPIVLLKIKQLTNNQTPFHFPCHSEIAPNNPYLGVMLPCTPLHHLLMAELAVPIIATSGNLSDEPICIDEKEALHRLADIADLFLIHNRPILRPVDDSIVRVIAGREMVIRRARGYAPLPLSLQTNPKTQNPENSNPKPQPILAVGAHLKNTIALKINNQVFISQHIGDLETPQAFQSFEKVIDSFKQLYDCQPVTVICDAHPDYQSTIFAHKLNIPLVPVQHHIAHILACMAENQILGKTGLGIAWDGTGYGLDGTIWGGEFFSVSATNNLPPKITRIAHFRTFPLAGGDKAIKEPRRIALGLLYQIFGDELFTQKTSNELILYPLKTFTPQELKILHTMFQRQINTPITSSVGRLFDAVASLVGLRQKVTFEGQGAMELEFAINNIQTHQTYPFQLLTQTNPTQTNNPNHQINQTPISLDWQPLILALLKDIRDQVPVSTISAKFHNTLVETIVNVAKYIGEKKIILSGGCFQNKYLAETAITRLTEENFHPYWHQRIPPNDGGISLGQTVSILNNI